MSACRPVTVSPQNGHVPRTVSGLSGAILRILGYFQGKRERVTLFWSWSVCRDEPALLPQLRVHALQFIIQVSGVKVLGTA